MKTRLYKKRRIPEDFIYPMEQKIMKRSKHCNQLKNDQTSNLRIVLRKISPTTYTNNDIAHNIYENIKHENNVLNPKPWLNIPRIDETRTDVSSYFEDELSQQISRKEDRSRFEFTSVRKTSLHNGFRGYETVTTSNILSFRTETVYIPMVKFNDSITKETNTTENNEVHERTKKRILMDMKNVVNSNNKLSVFDMPKETKSYLQTPARGRENVDNLKSKRGRKKKVNNPYHETPLSRFSNENCPVVTNLVVSLERICPMNHQFVEEEVVETTSKIKKQSRNSLTEIQKNVKIRKTRGIAVHSNELGLHQNRTEIIRECHVEKVKNVCLVVDKIDDILKNSPPVGRMTRSKTSKMRMLMNYNNEKLAKNTSVIDTQFPKVRLVPYEYPKLEKNKQRKKKLNVSFKIEADIIDDIPLAKLKSMMWANRDRNPITSTPCQYVQESEESSDAFLGFNEPVDLSSHSKFCSHVLDSINTSRKKSKRRMSKVEAAKRTEIVNLCKKTIEKNRRPVKSSQRLAIKRMKQQMKLKTEMSQIQGRLRSRKREIPTPYVSLNKLSEADISSYKITPLREERSPLNSKTEDDYGIDDVNTDDSTDDEDCPKKTVPVWAKLVKQNQRKTFNPQDTIPKEWKRTWMRPPTHKFSLKNYLFPRTR